VQPGGPDAGCDHVVRGATEEEALWNAAEHAERQGSWKYTPELMERVKLAMHDEEVALIGLIRATTVNTGTPRQNGFVPVATTAH
jgi:hypothetical protein